MEEFVKQLKETTGQKNVINEFNRVLQEFQERSLSFCTKKCFSSNFRKPALTHAEGQCLKQCYGLLNHFSYEYFEVINDYNKYK